MKNRLQGTWEFIYVSVNDVDSTEVFRQRIGCYMDLEGIVKAEGANLGDVQILDSTKKILVTAKSQFQKQPSDNQGPSVDIYIQFDNGSFNNIYPFGPFAPDIHSTGFTIKRLTKDELWLERTATYFPPAGTVKQTHYFKLKKV